MKRLLILLLIMLQIVSLFGCQQKNILSNGESTHSSTIGSSEPNPPTTDDDEQSSIPDTTIPDNTTSDTTTETTEPDTSAPTVPTDPIEPDISDKTDPVDPPDDVPEPDDQDFVRIADYIPTAKIELPYATVNNFTGNRIYDFTDSYLRYGTVKKLMKVSEELERKGLGLIIWDGFRPVAAQAKLWEICPDPTFVSHPVTGKRTHCRGNTVDISLYDLATGKDVAVPTGYDNFTAYADRDYSDCSEQAATNARLLEQIMKKNGFTAYFAEWWHFADTVDYPVDEYFNPAIPTTWAANCNEYISLRKTPGGKVITRIPKGGIVELQSWDDKYAKVSYNGLEGYVLTNYIMPYDDTYFSKCLDTVKPTNQYTYSQMIDDMNKLKKQYPNVVTISSIGTSEMGRDIPVILIGDLDARYHVLLQGSIHGREHLTAWLLMAMADYWLDHGIMGYGNVCYHIIPMTNPDGVIISQTQSLSDAQHQIYLSDKKNGYTTQDESTYASTWKANGQGVDINRNFLSGWESIDDRTGPSSERYQGAKPFSSAEAAALRDYTLKYSFDATISYHTAGSIIYYEYGNKEPVNSESKSLAKTVNKVSGYSLANSVGIDGAGYKDWVMDELGIPSITVEIGVDETPLALREIYSIFVRNYCTLPAIARWLQI